MRTSRWLRSLVVGTSVVLLALTGQAAPPRSLDDRLTVELFAEHPQIMTPTGLAVDARGRVFVAESHTHFRPDGYDGPPADRILIFQDRDGDGKAEPPTVFHEGFVHVMDIEFHHDGSLFVATRKDIHRLRDTNGDDRADDVTPIVRLETKGNYPHNGLSGIAFLLDGSFHFGLGENLGEPYTLIGSDGGQLQGGGEGGSTYHCRADGSQLRRISTGWWNPYGMCTDSFGRVFGTDNDPDSSPPCRLIQVVRDGDFGYEFRYGRSGRNPLITWNGEIPGTLPMIAGTGEAPCHLIAYESDGLPEEYFGNLLVASWADHRLERYVLAQRPDQGFLETKRQVLIEGPDDFRPVGIDVAPDGSLYLSDWVSSSYTLHKQGRIWRIRTHPTAATKQADRSTAPWRSLDRRQREAAARDLAKTEAGRKMLRDCVTQATVPAVQATALAALATQAGSPAEPVTLPTQADSSVQEVAARLGISSARWPDPNLPPSVRAALLEAASAVSPAEIAPWLSHQDPRLRHAAQHALSRQVTNDGDITASPAWKQLPALGRLLALKHASLDKHAPAASSRTVQELAAFLESSEPAVRFAAVKWVADDLIGELRPQIEQLLTKHDLDLRTFLGVSVALDRLDRRPVVDRPAPDRLRARILDPQSSVPLRQWCLRLVDPNAAKLTLAELAPFVEHPDARLQLDGVRTIARLTDPKRLPWLESLANQEQQPAALRAEAIAGLSTTADQYVPSLLRWAASNQAAVRDEALRSLVGLELTDEQRQPLRQIVRGDSSPHLRAAIARIVDRQPPSHPAATDPAPWLKFLELAGDRASGERIFLGTKIGRCSTCHQVGGLGASVGPDLSQIHQRVSTTSDGKRWLVETILQPSRDMAPQFTPWQIVTTDGRQFLGLPRRKGGDSEAYLGTDGREFSLKVATIELRQEATTSIMPADLLQQLTDQELADLFAFLLAP